MSAALSRDGPAAVDHHLYAAFVAALPKILNVAGYRFRRVPCPDAREDCVCETVALCWVWFVRLVQKTRRPCQRSSPMSPPTTCGSGSSALSKTSATIGSSP